MNKFEKWKAVYEQEKEIIRNYKEWMKPHQKAMKHARLMRDQSKKQ
jgi:hypothetical protein